MPAHRQLPSHMSIPSPAADKRHWGTTPCSPKTRAPGRQRLHVLGCPPPLAHPIAMHRYGRASFVYYTPLANYAFTSSMWTSNAGSNGRRMRRGNAAEGTKLVAKLAIAVHSNAQMQKAMSSTKDPEEGYTSTREQQREMPQNTSNLRSGWQRPLYWEYETRAKSNHH